MPLAFLLIPYGLFLLFFALFAFASVAHVFIFGEKNATTFIATFIFLVGTIAIANTAWRALAAIDWQTSINLMEAASSLLPF